MAAKKILQGDITGAHGISFISGAVAEMGYLWHPSIGPEAGIDGVIELRDPKTGDVTNCIIQVQSKATAGQFQAETEEGFDFLCAERDLDYWLSGNAPVILVVSRPSSREGYWVSVKEYFHDIGARKARKVHFRKAGDRFDASAAARLAEVAIPRTAGIYLSPVPTPERVFTNLLAVTDYPRRIHHAATDCADGYAVRGRLIAAEAKGADAWMTRGKYVLSFHDLGERPWVGVCDPGTHEEFDTSDWADSDDLDRRRDFVQLLNACLRTRLSRGGVRFDRKRNVYYFGAAKVDRPRTLRYRSLHNMTEREVVVPYWSKKEPKRVTHYRHFAFEGHFVRYDGRWYLEVVPTYVYTSDGRERFRFEKDQLSGIKRIEDNDAVLGQVMMWAAVLGRPSTDLFSSSHVAFGELVSLETPVGLCDEDWLPPSEARGAAASENLVLPGL